jgi:glucuronoarabinoxylan endo-1,4-beta-xylanase
MADAVGFTDSVTDPTLNDSNAVKNISIVSGHFYGGGNRVHSNALAHGKPVWMTEHYLDGGTTNFPVCLNFAKEINDAMKNQFSAYIAWWAYDGDTNINLANSSGTIFKDGYTLGQFSKFIRPGYYRVGTTSVGSGAQITAYKDLISSNVVIVALNLGSTVITQQFNFYGFSTSSITPWITS